MIAYFIRQWAPLTPLWTAIIVYRLTGERTATNAVAESMFFTIKQSYMGGEQRWPIEKFVPFMSGEYK